jgi:hypothetical protein
MLLLSRRLNEKVVLPGLGSTTEVAVAREELLDDTRDPAPQARLAS